MSVDIKEVTSKSEIKKSVLFQFELYKDNPYFVPQLIRDEVETLSKKNPATELSDMKVFLAYRDGKIVGRIVGIINHPANKKWGTKNIRFGWIEMINDFEVTSALFNAVEKMGKEAGMETITGPHGFCDLDMQGMLVEGFDKLATIASYYHHPYYSELTERYGFTKDVDYLEYFSTTPAELPEQLLKVAEWIQRKGNYRLLKYNKVSEYKKRGKELFNLLEESFSELYGTVPLSNKQVDYYINKYISFIDKNLIKIVVTEKDEMIGFLITMPNLSKAYQKAKGKLLPLGIFHLLKGMKNREVLDFYFMGVKKEYRGKGIDVLMAAEIVKTAIELGFKHAESNQELEWNNRIQSQWKFFNPVLHKRRRIYKKNIDI